MPEIQARKHKNSRAFDAIIYIIAILAPLMTLPQLYKVWTGNHVQGVSIYTWATYAVISMFWLIYGLKGGLKPIVFTNGLLLFVDALIVVGLIAHT